MPIYGLSFHKLSQTGYFRSEADLVLDDCVIVEVDQGQTLARVVNGPFAEVEGVVESQLPRVVRPASTADLSLEASNVSVVERAKAFWHQCVKRRHLDMKLVDVEVFLDRSKFIFYFTAPVRIDFRELVKDLVHEYRVRIELRQIGVRHEAQMIGAVGNCGMVCCCRRFLHQFAPVTIRMAKDQNLFLNPTKVSGICGRLLCCLAYEQESYDAFHRECPKLSKKYQTRRGTMKVIRANMFCNTVTCVTENNEEIKLSLEEWKALDPHRPEPPASSQPHPAPAGPSAQDELMVVQATPEDVADTHFLDSCFPAGTVAEAGSLLPDEPVMQPGEDEIRSRKKKHRKGGRAQAREAARRAPAEEGGEGAKPQAPAPDAGGGADTAAQGGARPPFAGRQKGVKPSGRGHEPRGGREGSRQGERREGDARPPTGRRLRKELARQGRGARPAAAQDTVDQQKGRPQPASGPDAGQTTERDSVS